jgi:hypothetical protein
MMQASRNVTGQGHLTQTELVDLIDGCLPEVRVRHLDGCGWCTEHAASMRETLAASRAIPAHEPSPLFWEHLARRISDSVADEPAATPAPGWIAALRNPAIAWAAAASVAVLMMVTSLWHATLGPGASQPVIESRTTADAAGTPDRLAVDDLADDEAWAVVRSAAEGLGWEDAHSAGITAAPGAAEAVVYELSREERAELARLLEEELKRTGA